MLHSKKIFAPLDTELLPELQSIEVATTFQIPSFQIIGLPAPEINEAQERVRAAFSAAELEFPKRRVIINLSPSSIKKRGTGLDLPMALAIALQFYELPHPASQVLAFGELGLDGTVKSGEKPIRSVVAALRGGIPKVILSVQDQETIHQASDTLKHVFPQFKELEIQWVHHFKDIFTPASNQAFLHTEFPRPLPPALESSALLPIPDTAAHTLGLALSGHHHLMILGPQGSGKSHLTEWITRLPPWITPQQKLERHLLHELSPLAQAQRRSSDSYRRISPLVRPSALIGGGIEGCLRAGEFALAHGGILIADEFPEWHRDSRETLRDPLERGQVLISQRKLALELPARFLFVANGNLCPCGGTPESWSKLECASSHTPHAVSAGATSVDSTSLGYQVHS